MASHYCHPFFWVWHEVAKVTQTNVSASNHPRDSGLVDLMGLIKKMSTFCLAQLQAPLVIGEAHWLALCYCCHQGWGGGGPL